MNSTFVNLGKASPDFPNTNNFKKVIGKGGSGTVYGGCLKDGTQVAVKMSESTQVPKEFQTEASVSFFIMNPQHLLKFIVSFSIWLRLDSAYLHQCRLS